MQQELTHQNFLKTVDLARLKSEVYALQKVPTGLNSLKSKIDKLDINKIVPVPVDLNKLSDAVRNDVVKKMYFTLRSKDKIPNILANLVSNVATNTTLNAKINEVKNEIPSVTNLATMLFSLLLGIINISLLQNFIS